MDLNREEAQKLLELLKNERLSQEEREVFLRNLKESFPDLWEEYVLWKALSRSEEVSFHWKESLDLKRKRSYTLLIVSLSVLLCFIFFLFYVFPPLLDFHIPHGSFIPSSLLPSLLFALAISLFLYER